MTRSRLGRVTIRTVAQHAGVSPAAVSKVLRDAYGVSDALRVKVQLSINRLGYRPLMAARALRGRAYMLGVVFEDISNPFFSDIMAGINTELENTAFRPMLGITKSDRGVEKDVIEALIDCQMDGLILIAPLLSPAEAEALAARIPLSMIGFHQPRATLFDTVNNDDQKGAMLVVDHLVAQGFRDIAFLSVPRRSLHGPAVQLAREHGFWAAIAGHGLAQSAQVVRSSPSAVDVRATVFRLLGSETRPQAIFCWTDFVALEVLSAALEFGVDVPRSLAIVGYDNIRQCDLRQNNLTSIDQSGQRLGRESVRVLLERINGRLTSEHVLVAPRLVPRGTSDHLGLLSQKA